MQSDYPEDDGGKRQNGREVGHNPIRVPEMFEYAGDKFKKEYVERGAVVVSGVIGGIIFWIYYAGRN